MKVINILLVDDDLKNSMLLKRFLEVEGYSVTYANNGAVGWELFHTSKPDLVLLDINMLLFFKFIVILLYQFFPTNSIVIRYFL